MTRRLPEELTGGTAIHERFMEEEVLAAYSLVEALLADVRFEHLDDDAKEAVWYFVAECVLERGQDHVPRFLERHAREPMTIPCYLPVKFLKVQQEIGVLGLRFLPVHDERVPPAEGKFSLRLPVASVAVVQVNGSNYRRMAGRAAATVSHVLRLLRVAFRANPGIHPGQLRFRIGDAYSFDDRIRGWHAPDDAAYELTVMEELVEAAISEPVTKLPVVPATDIQNRANIAVQWMDRASLSGEPLVALLYLFFALEALLGRKNDKLKGHHLAFRQTLLSHIVSGGFSDPNRTFFLYDEVRSAAVHGEPVPRLDWSEVRRFSTVVRSSLNQYLSYAEAEGFRRRGRLLRALDEHPDCRELLAWLRRHSHVWDAYELTGLIEPGQPAGRDA